MIIIERLYYMHPEYHSLYCAGTRVSCDGGRSWITRGTVVIDGEKYKQVSMINREVDKAEFLRRVADFENLGRRLDLSIIPPHRVASDFPQPASSRLN